MRASNDFDVSHYEIKTIKRVGVGTLFNVCVTFQCRGLNHLEQYCILTVETCILIADILSCDMYTYLDKFTLY